MQKRVLALLVAACVLLLGGCAGAPDVPSSSDTGFSRPVSSDPVSEPPSADTVWESSSSVSATPDETLSVSAEETPTGADSNQETPFTLRQITPGSIYTGDIQVLMPEASGTAVLGDANQGLTIDVSHTDQGYIMVKCTSDSGKRMKVRLACNGAQYDYDLRRDGEYEVYPLQMGSGTYTIKVWQNLEGTRYVAVYTNTFNVSMPDVDRVFVYPSQYVWYTNDENAVKLSFDLCEGLTDPAEKVARIYDYLVWYLSYDTEKAKTVEKGYIPDVDEILQLKKGICFDYSALMASMCRAQEIPTRLVIGYAQPGNIYHAWNQVYIDGAWVWMDATFAKDPEYKESNYTEERRY